MERSSWEGKKWLVSERLKQRQRSISRQKKGSLSVISEDVQLSDKDLYVKYMNQKEESKELKEKVQKLQNQLKYSKKLLKELLDSANDQKQKIRSTNNAKIKDLSQQIENLRSDITKSYQTQGYQTTNQCTISQLTIKESEITNLREQLASSDRNYIIGLNTIEQLKELLNQKQRLIESKDTDIKHLIQQLGEKRSQLKTQNSSLTGSLHKIESPLKSRIPSIDSKVLANSESIATLCEMLSEKGKAPLRFQLLYRASWQDFRVVSKGRYCGIPHTVLLVKTEYEKIIGGYTPLMWKLLEQYKRYQYEQDQTGSTFIFSISNGHKLKHISPKNKYAYAIQHHNKWGPMFYYGLCISDQSNINRQSCSEVGSQSCNYVNPEYKSGKDIGTQSAVRFCGSEDGEFKVLEWEVHEVIFEEKKQ